MKKIIYLLALTFLIIGCDDYTSKLKIVIKDINIIDVRTGQIIDNQNIVIEEGIIKSIVSILDEIDIHENDQVIDGKNKYVIPTLWEMHAHLHDSVSIKIEEFKDYGIFGIRDMGAFKRDILNFQNEYTERLSREHLNYRFFPVGYIHNGKECEVDEHQIIDSRSDLIESISLIKSANIEFFKIHNCFPNKLLDDLVELCEENELKIVGHIPKGIDPLKYTEYKISSIEHMDSFIRGLFSREINPAKSFRGVIDILDGPYLDSIAINLKLNNIAITPTLVTYENFVKNAPKEQQASGIAILRRLQNYTKRLHDNGVQILIGTDFPLGGLKAGKSFIREMELLIESGIEPKEVLLMATHDSAKYLGIEDFQIQEGFKANFIVLADNPINNIETLHNVKAAIINGKFIWLKSSVNNN